MKKYLRITPDDKDEWVDRPEEATSDYHQAVVVTQERLKRAGLETTLMEIPDPHLMQSKWVICMEDVGAHPGYGRGKFLPHPTGSLKRRKRRPRKKNTKLRYK